MAEAPKKKKAPARKAPARRAPRKAAAKAPAKARRTAAPAGSGSEPRTPSVLSLHSLSPAPGATRSRKRIGRGPGSGHGKTAGRGNKGFWSRSGSSQKRGFEGGQMPLHRRVPKRGFTNIFRKEFVAVNVDTLAARFAAGSTVGPDELKGARLVRRALDGIKVLGRGEIAHALTVRAHRFSAEARRKIEAAGGKVETL